jgi:Mrp family chromosome partitioning ATPase
MTIENIEDFRHSERNAGAARRLFKQPTASALWRGDHASLSAGAAPVASIATISSAAAKHNEADVEVRLEPSSQAIETLYQRTIGDGRRVVALIAIERGDGASTVARALAERASLAPMQTLLVDASGKADTTPAVHPFAQAFERLEIRPDADRFRYRSTEYLRSIWREAHSDRDAIVIDCAPALAGENDSIPGVVAARSADAIVLVGRGGSSTRESIDLAKAALNPAEIVGIIVNGRDQPTVGDEVAREAMRLSRFLPPLGRALAKRARRWSLLDVPA